MSEVMNDNAVFRAASGCAGSAKYHDGFKIYGHVKWCTPNGLTYLLSTT